MKHISSVVLASLLLTSACSQQESNSQQKVVDINHSSVKWQSIGNCWVYATTGWMEAILLRAGQEEMNLSETYLTYRHYQEQMMRGSVSQLATGGFWRTAKNLVLTYGVISEADFIPEESSEAYSLRQKTATADLQRAIQEEAFQEMIKTASYEERLAVVTEMLDEAFGVKMEELADKIIPAEELTFIDEQGEETTIADELQYWNIENNYQSWYSSTLEVEDLPAMSARELSYNQINLQRRVMRALNAGEPVILEWFVDFNAMNSDGVFSHETLRSRGPGSQGYHQTVIEDYTVEITDPETGDIRILGEGELSDEDKELAATEGRIASIIVKNSWGGNERTDRASYQVGESKGYHRLQADYLYGFMKVADPDSWKDGETGLRGFILPAGY